MPILYNDERKKSYFKKIKIPFDIVIENIKLVKNFENDNLFLITTQINKNMYVIDYINNKTNIHQFNQLASPFDNKRKNKKINFEDFTNKELNDKNSENILINKKSKRRRRRRKSRRR